MLHVFKGKMKSADDVLTSWFLTLNIVDTIRMHKEINHECIRVYFHCFL